MQNYVYSLDYGQTVTYFLKLRSNHNFYRETGEGPSIMLTKQISFEIQSC